MHGLIFETSIWLLAGSTRYLSFGFLPLFSFFSCSSKKEEETPKRKRAELRNECTLTRRAQRSLWIQTYSKEFVFFVHQQIDALQRLEWTLSRSSLLFHSFSLPRLLIFLVTAIWTMMLEEKQWREVGRKEVQTRYNSEEELVLLFFSLFFSWMFFQQILPNSATA